MITITGENLEELKLCQHIVEVGVLNNDKAKGTKLHVVFKLANGNQLLVNKYERIVGEKYPDGTMKFVADED